MPRLKVETSALCPQCGQTFVVTHGRRFCTTPCREAFAKRMAVEGRALNPFLRAYLETRGGGGRQAAPVSAKARSEMTRIAAIFRDEDREAGRPPIAQYVESLLADGVLFMDRRRAA